MVVRPLPKIAEAGASLVPGSKEKSNRLGSKQKISEDDTKQTQGQVPAGQQNTPSATQKKTASGARDPASVHNVVTKFSFATKGGIAAHNPYKVNQDAYLTNPHMLNLRHCHFFSVCDGHGHNGQEVSGLLKHRLPF
jgi:hypothetical protein